MNVTSIQNMPFMTAKVERTDDHMRREFSYIVAGQITRKLLDQGLITQGEFDMIMAKNREKFSPAIAGFIQNLT